MQQAPVGLSEEEASSACALSIRRLCDGCAPLLGGHMGQLLELYRQVQGSGEVAENAFNLDLDEDDVQQVGWGAVVQGRAGGSAGMGSASCGKAWEGPKSTNHKPVRGVGAVGG